MLVETCQDVLQIKAALTAIESVFEKKETRLPLMVSVTRKSFLQRTVGKGAAGAAAATLAAELACVGLGADYVRTHDVEQLLDGIAVWQRLGVIGINLRRGR